METLAVAIIAIISVCVWLSFRDVSQKPRHGGKRQGGGGRTRGGKTFSPSAGTRNAGQSAGDGRGVSGKRIDYANLPPVQSFPYTARRRFFTKREEEFWRVLMPLCHERGFEVCAKVRVADVLWTPDDAPEGFWYWFSPISQKHIDFALLQGGRVVCCIELDDSSHETIERKQADAFKDRAFEAAHLPLYRYKGAIDEGRIRALVSPHTR